MPDPEAPDRIMRAAKTDALVVTVAQLFGLTVIGFVIGMMQIPVVLGVKNGLIIYAVAAGFIASAIALAWAFGLWRASWFARIAAALICVVVPSWPLLLLLYFAACYFGCRFW